MKHAITLHIKPTMYITKSMMFTPLFKFSFTCRSSPGPSSEDQTQTYIFGDSLTKLLHEDWQSSDTKFFSCPGETIYSLRDFILSLKSYSLPTPKTITLHVGTNALKKTSLRQARQCVNNLLNVLGQLSNVHFPALSFPLYCLGGTAISFTNGRYNIMVSLVYCKVLVKRFGCRFVNFSQQLVAEKLYAVDGCT